MIKKLEWKESNVAHTGVEWYTAKGIKHTYYIEYNKDKRWYGVSFYNTDRFKQKVSTCLGFVYYISLAKKLCNNHNEETIKEWFVEED